MNDVLVPDNVPVSPIHAQDALIAAFFSGRTETTLRAYRRDLEDFRQYTGDVTLALAATRLLQNGAGRANALVLGYRAQLLGRGLQPATINRRLAALRSLVKLARLFGQVNWSLETPPLPTEPYRDTRGPGKNAFALMLQAVTGDTSRAFRDRAILRLLYDLGLRRAEVVSLDVADVDKARGTIAVQGKGRRDKVFLSLAAPTQEALAAWLNVRGEEAGPLFTSFDRAHKGDGRLSAEAVYQLVRNLGAQIGVKCAPHGLRHTAITEACKAAQNVGIGLEEVLDFSRHKSVAVLMLYRDRERNVQGKLSGLVAQTVETGTNSETTMSAKDSPVPG